MNNRALKNGSVPLFQRPTSTRRTFHRVQNRTLYSPADNDNQGPSNRLFGQHARKPTGSHKHTQSQRHQSQRTETQNAPSKLLVKLLYIIIFLSFLCTPVCSLSLSLSFFFLCVQPPLLKQPLKHTTVERNIPSRRHRQ